MIWPKLWPKGKNVSFLLVFGCSINAETCQDPLRPRQSLHVQIPIHFSHLLYACAGKIFS